MLSKDISFCHFTIQEAKSTKRHNVHIAISNTIHYLNFKLRITEIGIYKQQIYPPKSKIDRAISLLCLFCHIRGLKS